MNTVTLNDPVTVDGNPVSEITLRKPTSGELRGLSLVDILRMETTAMLNLLPRITQPPLNAAQLGALDPADFTDLAGKTVLFFAKKQQLEGQLLEMQATA
ncbi:phage tail assembly protein [Thalassobius sp. I31.1]|uniref:phage tail assembly protein n=1 Tax=Thalassobius sp. I31.1 TaxID=2109912 RepID=UPI0013009A94|nr:phage tail assembly protein [Thalassobius sp. I31.1]